MNRRTTKPADPLAEARDVLAIEAEAIGAVADALGESFARSVELIHDCPGRLIVAGMGKSGLVGKKIAATLSSTGTPSLFLHPAEATHGDLGIVTGDDLVMAISYSGKTTELLNLLPHVKRIGVKIIALTGNPSSPLARLADEVLSIEVPREACPWNVVPTSSTTATMALGDALAVTLLHRRGFRREDFTLFHPGGDLGRKLLFLVRDLMHGGEETPVVPAGTPLKTAIEAMTAGRLGVVAVTGPGGRCAGIFTDGDLRRAIQRHGSVEGLQVDEVMSPTPRTIQPDALAAEALRVMETAKITSLLVPDAVGRPLGIIHLHDILRAGIA